jgi:hypothetical protein
VGGWVGGCQHAACKPDCSIACTHAVSLLLLAQAAQKTAPACTCLARPLPAAVQRIMSRMRQEQGREAPAAGAGACLLAAYLSAAWRASPAAQLDVFESAELCCCVLCLS